MDCYDTYKHPWLTYFKLAMVVPAEPIAERNLFLTGTNLTPATSLSEKLGLSPGSRYEVDNDRDDEDVSDGSQCSDESLEEAHRADEATREDMARLGDTFRERGMRFRMIDRVGEGRMYALSSLANGLSAASRHIFHSLQS